MLLSDPAVELLAELVDIDSPSGDRDGLDKVANLMMPLWAAEGFHTSTVGTSNGRIVLARREMSREAPTVLLVGHMDTVFPLGTAGERPFRIADRRAFGPGVADAKGGLVGMLATYQRWSELANEPLNFAVLLNCDEEVSSVESRDVIIDTAARSDVALIFEPGRPDGSMIVARGGTRRYRLATVGRAAHTGVDPRSGANAIVALSHQVCALAELTDYDRGMLLNIGVISGGSRPNIVADAAEAVLDVRYPDGETERFVTEAVAAIAAAERVAGTSTTLHTLSDRPPMVASSMTRMLVELYGQCADEIGTSVDFAESAGGSDGNFTSSAGATTIDAVGPIGGRFHTADEYLEIDTIDTRSRLSALLLARLGTRLGKQER